MDAMTFLLGPAVAALLYASQQPPSMQYTNASHDDWVIQYRDYRDGNPPVVRLRGDCFTLDFPTTVTVGEVLSYADSLSPQCLAPR